MDLTVQTYILLFSSGSADATPAPARRTAGRTASSWGTNTWSLFARQGGESLQPGHSRSERSNSSDTDFEGQIWHRQSGHSGAGTCCVSDAGQRRSRSRARDPSPLAAFRLRNGQAKVSAVSVSCVTLCAALTTHLPRAFEEKAHPPHPTFSLDRDH